MGDESWPAARLGPRAAQRAPSSVPAPDPPRKRPDADAGEVRVRRVERIEDQGLVALLDKLAWIHADNHKV